MKSQAPDLINQRTAKALMQLGDHLALARLRRGWTKVSVARRLKTTELTVRALEEGKPTVRLGMLAAYLQLLGLETSLLRVADPADDPLGQAIADQKLRGKARANRPGDF